MADVELVAAADARTPRHQRASGSDPALRIAMLVDRFPKLSETFVLNQISGLIDLGHRVDIFARSPGNERTVHSDIIRYGLSQKTTYHGGVLDHLNRTEAKSVGQTEADRQSPPLHAVTAPQPSGVVPALRRILTDARLRLAARQYYLGNRDPLEPRRRGWVRTRRYDAIVAHFGGNGIDALKLRRAGIVEGPLVVIFHGNDVSRVLKRSGTHVYRDVFAHAALVLPVSTFWRDRLVTIGCPAAKLRVLRMGVDLTRISGARQSGALPPNRPYEVVTTARLVEKKGLADAIRAVAVLQQRGIDVRYRILGDGPLRQVLSRQVDALGLNDRVTFCGALEQDAVLQHLKTADVFLLPSVTATDGDMEGVPVSLMEAMAMSLPVVSTWHSGIPELVEDGGSGFLVNEHDVDSLAERMIQLANDDALRARMGACGAARVARDYASGALHRQLVSMLTSLKQAPA